MKRGGYLRRKSTLRKKSRTNSRPHENVALQNEYRAAHQTCEIYQYLREFHRITLNGKVNVPLKAVSLESLGIHLHHIFNIGGTRPDYWSNFCCIGWPMHSQRHDETPHDITVACLYSKWRKGGRDWDLDEMDIAAGMSVIGWLQCVKVKDQFNEMRLRILHQESP